MIHLCLCIAALLPLIESFAVQPLDSRLSLKAQIILLDFFIEKTNVLFTYNVKLEAEAFCYARDRFKTVRPTYAYEIAFFNHTGEPLDDVIIAQSVVKFWENETFHFGTEWQTTRMDDYVLYGGSKNCKNTFVFKFDYYKLYHIARAGLIHLKHSEQIQMLHRYDWTGCGMDLNETDTKEQLEADASYCAKNGHKIVPTKKPDVTAYLSM